MSIFLMILLAVLPVLLEWLLGVIKTGQHMSVHEAAQFKVEMYRYSAWLDQLNAANDNGELNHRQQQRLKKVNDLYAQIKSKAGQAGCEI